MLTISIPRLVESSKIIFHESTSQFFEFCIGNGCVVHLESTATSVMDEILHLPMSVQKEVIDSLANMVSTPGGQAIIEGDKKGRGARIVCLASDNPKVFNLLITH